MYDETAVKVSDVPDENANNFNVIFSVIFRIIAAACAAVRPGY